MVEKPDGLRVAAGEQLAYRAWKVVDLDYTSMFGGRGRYPPGETVTIDRCFAYLAFEQAVRATSVPSRILLLEFDLDGVLAWSPPGQHGNVILLRRFLVAGEVPGKEVAAARARGHHYELIRGEGRRRIARE